MLKFAVKWQRSHERVERALYGNLGFIEDLACICNVMSWLGECHYYLRGARKLLPPLINSSNIVSV
jgi:hypothetical protein